jgi:hypothetical protein
VLDLVRQLRLVVELPVARTGHVLAPRSIDGILKAIDDANIDSCSNANAAISIESFTVFRLNSSSDCGNAAEPRTAPIAGDDQLELADTHEAVSGSAPGACPSVARPHTGTAGSPEFRSSAHAILIRPVLTEARRPVTADIVPPILGRSSKLSIKQLNSRARDTVSASQQSTSAAERLRMLMKLQVVR